MVNGSRRHRSRGSPAPSNDTSDGGAENQVSLDARSSRSPSSAARPHSPDVHASSSANRGHGSKQQSGLAQSTSSYPSPENADASSDAVQDFLCAFRAVWAVVARALHLLFNIIVQIMGMKPVLAYGALLLGFLSTFLALCVLFNAFLHYGGSLFDIVADFALHPVTIYCDTFNAYQTHPSLCGPQAGSPAVDPIGTLNSALPDISDVHKYAKDLLPGIRRLEETIVSMRPVALQIRAIYVPDADIMADSLLAYCDTAMDMMDLMIVLHEDIDSMALFIINMANILLPRLEADYVRVPGAIERFNTRFFWWTQTQQSDALLTTQEQLRMLLTKVNMLLMATKAALPQVRKLDAALAATMQFDAYQRSSINTRLRWSRFNLNFTDRHIMHNMLDTIDQLRLISDPRWGETIVTIQGILTGAERKIHEAQKETQLALDRQAHVLDSVFAINQLRLLSQELQFNRTMHNGGEVQKGDHSNNYNGRSTVQ